MKSNKELNSLLLEISGEIEEAFYQKNKDDITRLIMGEGEEERKHLMAKKLLLEGYSSRKLKSMLNESRGLNTAFVNEIISLVNKYETGKIIDEVKIKK